MVHSNPEKAPTWQVKTDYWLILPSVNTTIDPTLCLLKHITVEQVARTSISLGKGALIAKMDIKLAYCIVPVSPLDWHYLGMMWNNLVYIDGMLPFGLRSAPKIFGAIADSIEWCCVHERIEFIYHYLDEFAIIGQPELEQCWLWLYQLQSVC